MNKEKLYQILDICSALEDVRIEVIKNHDNNLWWPLDINDYRKKLLIAGLSTRISYNMIDIYKSVIKKIDSFTYEQLSIMNDEEIISIIKPLGLCKTRLGYIKSMMSFINEYEHHILELSNDELIELLANNVHGASYKVAQCCVLYVKNYHCDVMPVDSGLKDMTLPCIGFSKHKDGIGHEYARKEIESIVKKIDLYSLIKKNGYQNLKFPDSCSYTWWAHLVLIYFKRLYCNKHKPEKCPLISNIQLSQKCKR